MNKEDEENLSTYYSDFTLRNADEVDLMKLLHCNLAKIILDGNNEERFSFKLHCRSDQVVDSLHFSISFSCIFLHIAIMFSITVLSTCDTNNKFVSGVLAFLSACLGNLIPVRKK